MPRIFLGGGALVSDMVYNRISYLGKTSHFVANSVFVRYPSKDIFSCCIAPAVGPFLSCAGLSEAEALQWCHSSVVPLRRAPPQLSQACLLSPSRPRLASNGIFIHDEKARRIREKSIKWRSRQPLARSILKTDSSRENHKSEPLALF